MVNQLLDRRSYSQGLLREHVEGRIPGTRLTELPTALPTRAVSRPATELSRDPEELAAEIHARRLQDWVKGRREKLDLSQQDVADRLAMSGRAYGNWERGRVREWTDTKLFALAAALEMTEFQTARLFWLAVGRTPQPELRMAPAGSRPADEATTAFLKDYRRMMASLSLPTFLIDYRWNVKTANEAYVALFSQVRTHQATMPTDNFLRFGLFHPDAPTLLADHKSWQLSMLAQLSGSLERYDQDPTLQAIRREVYLDPALTEAYDEEMPEWVLEAGTDLVHNGDTVRSLRHPDPHVGLQACRLVEETPRPLQALGLTRITLVLTDLPEELPPALKGPSDLHLA
ncbi:helix-turn-helix domain-containing protein [Streptomyces sp. NPDC057445]|uniref:MmyB family transcriptional regulator n=1 Tax=Streptomyces sp. NPDC057445 TaxID=3346136 RepID=UPI0036AE6CC1